jgi:hypothetical protein
MYFKKIFKTLLILSFIVQLQTDFIYVKTEDILQILYNQC